MSWSEASRTLASAWRGATRNDLCTPQVVIVIVDVVCFPCLDPLRLSFDSVVPVLLCCFCCRLLLRSVEKQTAPCRIRRVVLSFVAQGLVGSGSVTFVARLLVDRRLLLLLLSMHAFVYRVGKRKTPRRVRRRRSPWVRRLVVGFDKCSFRCLQGCSVG